MTVPLAIPPLDLTEAEWELLPVRERALLIAVQECDVYITREVPRGSNRGPRVDEMLRSAKCFPGNPWCAAFVSWCLSAAGWNPVSDGPSLRIMYPAAVVSWVAWAKRTKRLKAPDPARGDLFFYDQPGHTHIGFVTHAEPDLIETLEGNASSSGGREGSEVVRRTRPSDSPTGFISLRALPFDK